MATVGSAQVKLVDVSPLRVPLLEKIVSEEETREIEWEANKPDYAYISKVIIKGNKRTKDWVILRELQYTAGSRIATDDLDSLLRLESNKVFNTNLFITTKVGYKPLGNGSIELYILVLEKLYFYVLPVLDLGDRSLNEWLQNQGGDLDRLQYGFNVRKKNFRGRNESLKFNFRWGFNRSVGVSYAIPYVNKARTLGMSIATEYKENISVAYQILEDKQKFLTSDKPARSVFRTELAFVKRDSFYTSHGLNLNFHSETVSDSVILLNPRYFGDENGLRSTMRMFTLGYTFDYNFTDIRAYPLKGHIVSAGLYKYGLGVYQDIDFWELRASFDKFVHLTGRFYLSSRIAGKFTSSEEQPFSIVRGLGHSKNYVRGYDLNVINADQFIVNRNSIRFKLLDKIVKADKLIPFKQFSTIPLLVMLKVHFDNGYAQDRGYVNPTNEHVNRWLFGGGIGIDVFSFYNSTLRIEYSVNDQRNAGLFFDYGFSF